MILLRTTLVLLLVTVGVLLATGRPRSGSETVKYDAVPPYDTK
jgi:hypothetical protein